MYRVTGKCKKGNAWAHFEISPALELNRSTTYANIDEAKEAPIAQQLFYLPFVKKITLTNQALQIERFNILEWEEVLEEVRVQLETYLNEGGIVIEETPGNKVPVSVYAESTPNPSVMKFVANKPLVTESVEFKNIDEAIHAPLAQKLFHFPFVKEVFISANYVSITKYEVASWDEIVMEIRAFIRSFIEEGNPILTQHPKLNKEDQKIPTPQNLDPLETQIVSILEEYIKPAVASDGGNIAFDSYDATKKSVKVVLQGACSGCPSSTFTLKNGIENMLKEMMPGKVENVVAING